MAIVSIWERYLTEYARSKEDTAACYENYAVLNRYWSVLESTQEALLHTHSRMDF